MSLEAFENTIPVHLPADDPRQVTLRSGGLRLRWPGGGAVWQRPLAVVVQWDDETHHLPIPDATWRVVAAIWLAGLLAVGLLWWRRHAQADRLNRTNP
jgi:hypothetical protein